MTDRLAAADRPQAAPNAGEPSERPADRRSGPGGELDRLWARGRAFLGTDLAVMGGAMTWVSERHLVAAISNAGGFGVIASGSMPPALLDAEIAATAELTDKPFGVNLITLHPQLFELIDVCVGGASVMSCWPAVCPAWRRSSASGRAARASSASPRRW